MSKQQFINTIDKFKVVEVVDNQVLLRAKFQLSYHSFAIFVMFKKGSKKAILILDDITNKG